VLQQRDSCAAFVLPIVTAARRIAAAALLDKRRIFGGWLEPIPLKKYAPKFTQADFAALDAILAEYKNELHAKHPSRRRELTTLLHDVLMSRAE
jgi:DNA-binding GntR family transcriptional regulator